MAYRSLNNQQQVNKKEDKIMVAIVNNFREALFNQQPEHNFKKPAFTVIDIKSAFIDMNKSFQYVGDNSTFQKRITTILVVQWIAFSFMISGMAFFFRSPSFQCRIYLTNIFIACSQTRACELLRSTAHSTVHYVNISFLTGSFLNYNQKSITEDFHLYCDNQHWEPLAQSLFFMGGLISGYLFSYISGIIGRRSILMIILIISTGSIILCAFASSIQIFLVGYFLCGFGLFGYQTNVYIYIGEISAIRFRSIAINMLSMVFVGTPLFLSFLSFIPSWRLAFIFFALILMVTIPFSFKMFLESPRFLQSKKCYKQAREIFKKIAITNHRPPYQFKLVEEMQGENQKYVRYIGNQRSRVELSQLSLSVKHRTYNFGTLFKYGSVMKPTLILMYLWIFRFFMYYSLNLGIESILKSGLLLVITISSGAVFEVLGTFGTSILTTFLYNNYKLDVIKLALIVITICTFLLYFLTISIQCKLIPIFTQDQICPEIIALILIFLLIKFCNAVFFSALIVYYAEVYPTPVRSLGCGFTLTFGRLGTVIVPFYINYMKLAHPTINPLSIICPLSLVGVGLCWLLPITQLEGMKEAIPEQVLEDKNNQAIELQSRNSSQIDHLTKSKQQKDVAKLQNQFS